MLENITINQQSSIKIAGSKIIYFDPFGIEVESHDADVIFITHEHYDHFEPESIAKVAKEGTKLVAPESMKKQVVAESGIDSENCVFAEPFQGFDVYGLKVETVPAYNKLKPFHTKGKKWLGYIVMLEGTRYYAAGDTDDTDEVRNVKCDVAFVPIGGNFTMDKKHAADCVAAMKPETVIPIHYGSIVGSKEDGEDFKEYLKKLDADIRVELKL